MQPVRVIVVGAGNRGTGYATYALEHPDLLKVVGVAEPRDFYRESMVDTHSIPRHYAFTDWTHAAGEKTFADAVIIATPERGTLHVDAVEAFADKGYHILLEKPMATDVEGCRRIADSALRNSIIFAVCHVLRYTDYTQRIRSIISSGAIGEVISIQHLEPCGYWHFAHSYVRGNWRNTSVSSFVLLSKSCHDLDWLQYIMGCKCVKASSFGTLEHFRKEKKPVVAGDAVRCVDCAFESKCPYSAKKLYLSNSRKGYTSWPVCMLSPDLSPQGIETALEQGPYGRCVYECDNNVADNQVVNLLFESGKTAAFTMVAFTKGGIERRTRIFGTKGEIYGNGWTIELFDFLKDETRLLEPSGLGATVIGHHSGGDYRLMERFVKAVSEGKQEYILSGPEVSLETHLMVFAAEKSRLENRIVDMSEFARGYEPGGVEEGMAINVS